MTPQQLIALRAALRAILDTLPLGERVYLAPLYDRLLGYLGRCQIVESREMIATYPCPTVTLVAARDQALALFPVE